MASRLSAVFLGAAVCLGATLAAQAPAPVDQLSWLTGCWTLARADGHTEEVWLAPAGGAMLGMSRTIRNGRMTEHEFIVIRVVDGALAYVAKPSRQPEATFLMKTLSASEVVFENLAHDFPQRITYRKTEAGIAARIEGPMNGQVKGIDFAYAACR